jgi:hypothetical protein
LVLQLDVKLGEEASETAPSPQFWFDCRSGEPIHHPDMVLEIRQTYDDAHVRPLGFFHVWVYAL